MLCTSWPHHPGSTAASAARRRSTVSLSQAMALIEWTKLSPSLREEGSVFRNMHCLLITASKEARKIGILQNTPIVQGSTTTTVGRVSTQASKPHVFQSASPPSSARLKCSYPYPTAAPALVVVPAGNGKHVHSISISISPPGGAPLLPPPRIL